MVQVASVWFTNIKLLFSPMYLVSICEAKGWDDRNILFLITPSRPPALILVSIDESCLQQLLQWDSPNEEVHLFFVYDLEYY